MGHIANFSAQDIATIAAAGFMGVATLVLLILFASGKTPKSVKLWVVIIVAAAVVQLGTTYMNTVMKARISVSISPSPRVLPTFLGAPLPALPHLWVSSGPEQCDLDNRAYDDHATGCLSFGKYFQLDSPTEVINVSFDDVMNDFHDRILRLQAAITAEMAAQAGTGAQMTSGRAPIAENGQR